VKRGFGAYFTLKHSDALQRLKSGGKEALSDILPDERTERCAYVLVLDSGNVVFEQIDADEVIWERDYQKTRLKVVSGNDYPKAEIEINGVDYSSHIVGINIVVWDRFTDLLQDSISFNTFRKSIPCWRYRDFSETMLHAINFIHASPYTLLQYLLDKEMKDIWVYTEERYWDLAETLLFSIQINRDVHPIIKGFVSGMPFKKAFAKNQNRFGFMQVKDIREVTIMSTDVVLQISGVPNSQSELIIKKSQAKVIMVRSVIQEMVHYCAIGRSLDVFRKNHPDVAVIAMRWPYFPSKPEQRSENEEIITKSSIRREVWIEALKEGRSITSSFDGLGYDISSKAFLEMLESPPSHINSDGVKVFDDYVSTYVNTRGGHRVTSNQPHTQERTIYIVGTCHVFGVQAPDNKTVTSFLQQLFNKHALDLGIRVENYGMFVDQHMHAVGEIINSIPAKSNDILIFASYTLNWDFPVIDLKELFYRPHSYGEVFTDLSNHENENGYRAVAEKLFEFLKDNEFFASYRGAPSKGRRPLLYCYGVPQRLLAEKNTYFDSYGEELLHYKRELNEIREQTQGKIGAIVMNCNPFTLGHRHLIEYAAQQVEHLYVFVVEEDRSIFPFKDRLGLVKAGTADLANVTILPSGKFIISTLTFSEYFNKSKLQDKTIDPSQDVELFAKEIAPALCITLRFVGEEPLDTVTQQYNDTMRHILPRYGIEFIEIPRKTTDKEPISASRVRELLKRGDLEAIAKLVPSSTLEYLKTLNP
jgi:[citrate (pro-3S)-lyase] ligase